MVLVAHLLKKFPAVYILVSRKYCTAVAKAFRGQSVQHQQADGLL